MSSQISKKKKQTQGASTSQQHSNRQNKTLNKQYVELVFPVQFDSNKLTVEMKQQITQMQQQYLNLQTILLNNRTKYEEMFGGLAALLDQRGVSADQLAKFFTNTIYCSPDTQ